MDTPVAPLRPVTLALSAPSPRPASSDAAPAPGVPCSAPPDPTDPTAARLRELECLQALVVSTTAHELRTPLTVLRVHADLLMGGAADRTDDERASLEAISVAVARLQAVSDHLVHELRGAAGGAEDSLRRWLQVDPGSLRTRPVAA